MMPPASKTVYAVIGNVDLTEGRGPLYIKHLCEIEPTAIRLAKGEYVQGSNCPIHQVEVFCRGEYWYGPVTTVKPTVADTKQQLVLDAAREREAARETIIKTAQSRALTQEEVRELTRLIKESD